MNPPSIEISTTWFRVEGHLMDLVALNHWRQTADHDGGDHSPDQDYMALKRWLERANEADDVCQDGRLMFRLFDLLESFAVVGYPSRFTIPRATRYKVFLWSRHLRFEDTSWPPSKRQVQTYKTYTKE